MPPRTNTNDEEKNLNLLPPDKRRWLHSIQLAFYLANDAGNLHVPSDSGILTRALARNRKQLKIFSPKKAITERSFSFQISKLWNSLPTTYHTAASRLGLTNLLLAGGDLDQSD